MLLTERYIKKIILEEYNLLMSEQLLEENKWIDWIKKAAVGAGIIIAGAGGVEMVKNIDANAAQQSRAILASKMNDPAVQQVIKAVKANPQQAQNALETIGMRNVLAGSISTLGIKIEPNQQHLTPEQTEQVYALLAVKGIAAGAKDGTANVVAGSGTSNPTVTNIGTPDK